mgnify:CR=1 FL=1
MTIMRRTNLTHKTVRFDMSQNRTFPVAKTILEKKARQSEDFKHARQIQNALRLTHPINPSSDKADFHYIRNLSNSFKANNFFDNPSLNFRLKENLYKSLGQNIYAQRKLAKLRQQHSSRFY